MRRNRKQKNQRKIVVLSMISLLCIMTIGYAAFQTNLSISAKGNIASKEITPNDLKNKVVISGDGLYKDTYEDKRYIYRGTNPDNYIKFNNELWRIISIESNDTLKIMKNEIVGIKSWDTTGATLGSNDWVRPSDINKYLNNEYYNSFSTESQNQIQQNEFSIGPAIVNNEDLVAQIASENSVKWSGNVGLINLSDFFRANTNTDKCGNYKLHYDNKDICKKSNYIVPSTSIWTITVNQNDNTSVFRIGAGGNPGWAHALYNDAGINPTVYLKSSIKLFGLGTVDNPYIINK